MAGHSGPAGDGGSAAPLPEAPLVGGADPLAPKRRRQPRRLAALGALLALVVAAAVVVPMKLTGARAVSSGLGSVFSQPTVGFSFTLAGPKTSGDSLQLTLASKSGASLASAHSYLADVVIWRGRERLAELRETRDGIYLRLGGGLAREALPVFHRAGGSGKLRAAHGPLRALRDELAKGGWVGVRAGMLAHVLRRVARRLAPGLRGSLHKEVARVANSLGQSWDELVSLHEVSASGGTTQYSVSLSLRRFLLSAVGKIAAAPGFVPGIEVGLEALSQRIEAIPSSLSLPIDLWISAGSLVRFSVTYGQRTLDAVIDHPAPPSTPAAVSYLGRRQLRALLRAGVVGRFRAAVRAGSLSPPRRVRPPWGSVAAGFGLSLTSYSHTNSFSALLDRSSPYSLWALARKRPYAGVRSFVVDGASRRPGQLSVHLGAGGSYVVLAATTLRPGRCAGLLLTGSQANGAVLGAKRRPLVPYPFVEATPVGGCNAAAISFVPVAHGWYGYAPLSGMLGSMSSTASGQG